jgi:CheY-like chemotaxis protein
MADKQRVLVVEDDAQLRQTLASQLITEGYDVREASSGNEAIPMIHGAEYQLIILDLRMPYIDGFEVLKFIKATFPRTRVIVLTAYADLMNFRKCKELGADEVIGKPYDLEYLFETIKTILKQ